MIDLKLNPSDTGLSHLSFSAVHDYLTDRRTFKKRWIDQDYSRTPKLSLIEGSAFHAALDSYWSQIYAIVHFDHKGNPPGIDFDEMFKHANMKADMEFPKGTEEKRLLKKRIAKKDIAEYESLGCEIIEEKTEGKRPTTIVYAVPTVQSVMKTVLGAVEAYIAERTEAFYVPLAIEQSVVAQTKDVETGENHPFPLKARLDLLARVVATGRLAIVDHKFMATEADVDEDGNPIATPSMKLQAADYVSVAPALLEALGLPAEEVTTVIFDVLNKKTGKLTQVIVEVGETEALMWSRIYKGACYTIMLAYAVGEVECLFPPNPVGVYGDIDGWHEFEADARYCVETGTERKVEKQEKEYEPLDI